MFSIVWIEKNTLWEVDYIKELFSHLNCEHIFLERNINLDLHSKNILALVINEDGMQKIDRMYEIFIKKYKPRILVHLSDEYLICQDFINKFYPKFDLVLRQHTMYWYKYKFNNIQRIPFGYMSGIKDKIKHSNEKIYDWCFIGKIKDKFPQERLDRENMIRTFKKYSDKYFISENIVKEETPNIYSKSKFLPSGRNLLNKKINHPFITKNVYQDNNRIYDAIICNSIPLVCGEKEEIKQCFEGCILPLIEALNWEDMIVKISKMNEKDIQNQLELQNKWWKEICKIISDRIENTANKEITEVKKKKIIIKRRS